MIKNNIRKTVVSKDYTFCKSLWSKATGLMFSFKPKTLIFEFDTEQRVSLHMWFVFFPIDVVFLDSKFRVVEIKKEFRPFEFYNPKNKARYVVELPSGSVDKSKTCVGDSVEFK